PFTATISTGSSAMTRALSESGTSITASWAENEQVALIYTVGETKYNTTATVSAVDGGVATITATLEAAPTEETAVTLIYPVSATSGTSGEVTPGLLLNQDGTLSTIASKYDVRTGSGTLTKNGTTATLKENVTLTNQYAIWKLTLTESAKNLYITAGGVQIAGATLASAGTEFYVAVPAVSNKTVSTITLDESNNCKFFSKDNITLAASKYYQSSVTTTALSTVDVSGISGYTYISNNSILTGEYSGNDFFRIYINDGATVILKDVTITNTNYAGLECDGSATIILVGENKVTGNRPGIKAAESSGSTLTITGTGSLVATGSNNSAGIGSRENSNCGNITISGGTVTAQGGNYAAGIGTGNVYEGSSTCGDITITGGNVTATGGKKCCRHRYGKGTRRSIIVRGYHHHRWCHQGDRHQGRSFGMLYRQGI
ncbi:MAG: carbohydrate-binding domain-containing protein, partial [Prevotella sp.]|nr:carbohydrate-binding domain-containing protein [Prevotella sp.]